MGDIGRASNVAQGTDLSLHKVAAASNASRDTATKSDDPVAITMRAALIQTMVAHFGELNDELVSVMAASVPELNRPDEKLGAVLEASARTLLEDVARGLVKLEPQRTIPSHSAPLRLMRLLAERGVSANAAVRPYGAAQRWLARQMLWELEQLQPGGSSLAVVTPLVNWLLGYFEVLGEAVLQAHARTEDPGREAYGDVRAEDLVYVLNDVEDANEASDLLHHPMKGNHLAAIIWSDRGLTPAHRLVQLARSLKTLPAVTGLLVAPRDAVSVSVWLLGSGSVRQLIAQVERRLGTVADVRAAFGEPREGLPGFKKTYAQARETHRVALLPGSVMETTLRYRDVAPTCLLSLHPADAKPWAADMLGELGGDCEETARLRETLRVYLEAGENASSAAVRLYVHRNTVKARVARAMDMLAVPFEQNRLGVALALNYYCRARGPRPQ